MPLGDGLRTTNSVRGTAVIRAVAPAGRVRRYNLIEVTPPRSRIPCRVRLWLGYARFFAGAYVEDTGPSPDRDFGFAQIRVDL